MKSSSLKDYNIKWNKINLLFSSKSDTCLLCHYLKAHDFTDNDGDKYCGECVPRTCANNLKSTDYNGNKYQLIPTYICHCV